MFAAFFVLAVPENAASGRLALWLRLFVLGKKKGW